MMIVFDAKLKRMVLATVPLVATLGAICSGKGNIIEQLHVNLDNTKTNNISRIGYKDI